MTACVRLTLTCGDSSEALAGLPRVEAATASEQRANPAVHHAIPLSFHLTARVSITHTWDEQDNYSVSQLGMAIVKILTALLFFNDTTH